MTRAALDKDPQAVAAMFDAVAPRYDVTNTILSAGQDRRWRRVVADAVDLRAGEVALDLAAGTATSSAALTRHGGRVVACDFSLGMLTAGARRRGGADVGGVALVAGDGLRLPFADASFDAVTISFGLRNLQHAAAGLAELARVTRAGGRLVVCEFSHPRIEPLRRVYVEYLMRALPAVARRVATNPEAYVYLAESIRAWPAQAQLADLIEASGWAQASWRDLSGGIVAVHRARRPGPPSRPGQGRAARE